MISEKNVGEEFMLSYDQLSRGIEEGRLKAQYRSCHGHSFRMFFRDEVAQYLRIVGPDPELKAINDARNAKYELSAKRARMLQVTTELNNFDARKAALIREKQELEGWLLVHDPKTIASVAKVAAKATAKAEKEAGKATAKFAKILAKACSATKKRKIADENEENYQEN